MEEKVSTCPSSFHFSLQECVATRARSIAARRGDIGDSYGQTLLALAVYGAL